MNVLIWGNAVSFVASSMMFFIGFIKKKKNILTTQSIQYVLFAIGNGILGGWSGAISNLLSAVRNVRNIRKPISVWEKLIYCGVQIVLSVLVGTHEAVAWFPVIVFIVYTFLLTSKNEIVLKGGILFSLVLWVFYDLSIVNYASAFFDVITIFSNIIGIILILRSRKAAAAAAESAEPETALETKE